MSTLAFDSLGRASLDGTWDFFPGDHPREELDGLTAEPIQVPGLWEAQGHLELDGAAWYRRTFTLDDATGHWTLHVGAAMDLAEVHLNGELVGTHDVPFTPFDLSLDGVVRPGENVLEVRVVDPSLGDEEHLRTPHGKQGWMNHVFPSRPSLYLTYGGIWLPVRLRRHGPVVVRSVFVNGDPADLWVEAEVENRLGEHVTAGVGVRLLGQVVGIEQELPPLGVETIRVPVGSTTAPRWSPETPVLHEVVVDTRLDGLSSDVRRERFGLRTVRVEGSTFVVNDEPYRMKSVLVQGFTADRLYAEGDRPEIEHEVRAAKAMGFNTVRLHIKAFDPTYLEVCDEVGIFVHADLPVAEPIDHEQMGGDTVLVQRCIRAIDEQVRRDRNHPSIILWSAMNELCDGRREARQWDAYEQFARTLVATVEGADPTRPVIENDWVEPDPDRIFASRIMTAHWYGQLHADYFEKIETASQHWSNLGRPFVVSEYGDWGLPDMPVVAEPAFWDTRSIYATALAGTLWPATIGRFVRETQRYQGISDRLQTEVWRRHGGISGYCLTELTDVPHELNGLLDLHRAPKPLAVPEVARGNQPVLPMLQLDSLVAASGETLRAELHVSNDGPALHDVEVEIRFGDTAPPVPAADLAAIAEQFVDLDAAADRFSESLAAVRVATIPAHGPVDLGPVEVVVPDVPGNHDLVLRLRVRGELVAENRYGIHVVDRRPVGAQVQLLGDGVSAAALAAVGVSLGEHGAVVVVGEGALDAHAGAEARRALDAGGVAVVLAQRPEAAPHFPVPVTVDEVVTAWGSTVFHFTTDHGALPSLPRRNVLVSEDSTVQATSVISSIDGASFPDTPVVVAFKPVPGAMTGTIVGAHAVGNGRLVTCQYRLAGRAAAGDVAAVTLLSDILRWATARRDVMLAEPAAMADGRDRTIYRFERAVAR